MHACGVMPAGQYHVLARNATTYGATSFTLIVGVLEHNEARIHNLGRTYYAHGIVLQAMLVEGHMASVKFQL